MPKRAKRSVSSARAVHKQKIRYAVVGQGYFAQAAVLPAFAHARGSSELVALVSDDPTKLRELRKRYGVEHTLSYEEYDAFLRGGHVDAVYIALPNSMHKDFTVRAARAGIHVLCEKPMAVTPEECEAMIDACETAHVQLMIAYRLHFEEANLRAVEIVQSGKIGEPRFFNSVFSYQVKPGNIRTQGELGGGPLFDVGIYCINAARYLFRQEPLEVVALRSYRKEPRFREVEEQVSATLRFPQDKLATFTVSFGAAATSAYEVVGTRGTLRVDPAYEFVGKLKHRLTVGDKTHERTFAKRDQVAAELVYFSNCIMQDQPPEPSGREGLADVRIIDAIFRAAQTGRRLPIEVSPPEKRPSLDQEIKRPPVPKEPELVHADEPH